jgi:hypothetical protein
MVLLNENKNIYFLNMEGIVEEQEGAGVNFNNGLLMNKVAKI